MKRERRRERECSSPSELRCALESRPRAGLRRGGQEGGRKELCRVRKRVEEREKGGDAVAGAHTHTTSGNKMKLSLNLEPPVVRGVLPSARNSVRARKASACKHACSLVCCSSLRLPRCLFFILSSRSQNAPFHPFSRLSIETAASCSACAGFGVSAVDLFV